VDEQPLLDLIADLARQAADESLPRNLRVLARRGLEWSQDLLVLVRKGDQDLIDEHVLGELRDDGTRAPTGMTQLLPLWARGTAVLDALEGVVVVDEAADPVTVTVHWERVPVGLRDAAASLASMLVDAHRQRPRGGRPRKIRRGSSTKTR